MLPNKNHPQINNGYIYVTFFFTLIFVGRFIFPFGDEPDWSRRSLWYLNFLSNFPFTEFISQKTELYRNCLGYTFNKGILPLGFSTLGSNRLIDEDTSYLLRLSPFFFIDNILCYKSFISAINRFLITFIIFLPITILLLFRNFFNTINSVTNKEHDDGDFNNSIEIAGCTLLFPSILYYAGCFSQEQIAHMFMILFFVFFYNKIMSILICILIIFFDTGTGLFFLIFVIYRNFFSFLTIIFNLKYVILFFLVFCLISYVFKEHFVLFSEYISTLDIPFISHQIEKRLNEYVYAQNAGYLDKYPLFLRYPQIMLGLMYLSPSFIKSYPLYIYILSILMIVFFKMKKNLSNMIKNKIIYRDIITIIAFLLLTINIVTILPTHTQGKYYIVIIPFLLKLASNFYDIRKVFLFCINSSLILLMTLAIFIIA